MPSKSAVTTLKQLVSKATAEQEALDRTLQDIGNLIDSQKGGYSYHALCAVGNISMNLMKAWVQLDKVLSRAYNKRFHKKS